MPTRLRARIDALEVTTVGRRPQADIETLLAIGATIRAREELRFDYRTMIEDDGGPPRQVQPHHLVARAGRWYLVAWSRPRDDWRTYRVDKIFPRTPNGPRFTPREVPGGDVGAFLAARFKGSSAADAWPCTGEVELHRPIGDVVAFVGDGVVRPVGPDRCSLRLGAWSWAALAASFARFDADLDVVEPPELRQAFAELAERAGRAAQLASKRSFSSDADPRSAV